MIKIPAPGTVMLGADTIDVYPMIGTLPEMKTLGAKWKKDHWSLPAAEMHMAALRELLPDAAGTLQLPPMTYTPQGDDRLYPFQREAVGRLVAAPRGQLLCMSPGLGKTAVAINAADILVPDDQVVVVAPAALLRTWERQVAQWGGADKSVYVISGKPDWEQAVKARWLVVSWDTFSRHQDWFAGHWPLWVFDESVVAKSRRSNKSLAVRGGTRRTRDKETGEVRVKRWANLRKDVERVWLLSGSPTTRYQDDLWAQLALIWPRAFPSYWRFAERYCVVEETVWAKTVIGDRRDHVATAENSDLVTVIAQEDVIDLPEYVFETFDVELGPKQAAAYDEMLQDFVVTFDSLGSQIVAANKISQLVYLQQITSGYAGESAKADAVLENVTSGAYEGPHLVWTHWKEPAEALTKRLEQAGVSVAHVSGDDTSMAKDQRIEDYKNGVYEVLVLSLGVGKFGHTLTGTKTVHYVDKTWNADDYFQSLRRVRRIGLEHRPVVVTYRAPGTIDEIVELNLEGKLDSISRVTGSDLADMLRGLR